MAARTKLRFNIHVVLRRIRVLRLANWLVRWARFARGTLRETVEQSRAERGAAAGR